MTAVDDARSVAQARARAAEQEDFWADLMPTAAELVIRSGHGSRSMLQRKMRIPFDLAGQLLEELEELGVVSPDEGGAREVLVTEAGLVETLARIADEAGGEVVDDDQPGDAPGDVGSVNLVKDTTPPPATPGDSLVVRPGDDLVYDPPPRQVQTLVVRARQAAARQAVWVVDQPVVSRTVAVGRQLPVAGVRLAKGTPRGARRAVVGVADWVRDAQSANLMKATSEAGEYDGWTKVHHARQQTDLATRRLVVAIPLALVALVCLAWWAPDVFAGMLAALVFGLVVAVAPRSHPKEFLVGVAMAGAAGYGAWLAGPYLAGLVPQPPVWIWWMLAGLAVVGFGWMGRNDDPIIEMPMDRLDEANEPKRPTADMIVDALCRLKINGLTPAVIEQVRQETRVIAPGVARSRRGYHIQLELPWAVTAGDVMDKREQLAAALKRELGTVWPSRGPRNPAHLVLFLADRPMASAPQEPWPVAERGRVDVFSPTEMFTDQEGRWVDLQIAYKRILIGGESGSGKSFYARQIGVATAFDPRTRIVVFDGKANGDMDPLIPVAHGFYIGAQPDEMAEQLAAAQAIEREMDRRARFLRGLPREENPENKVTSALVDRYPDLAPYLIIVDELQEYTQAEDRANAKEFTRLFTRFSRLGRSAGVWLLVATQYPADGVVPMAMRSNFSTKFCLRVEGHPQVEVILGTGAYAAGLKANLFTANEAGLAWHKGDGQEPAIVRSVYGLDGPACDELVERARALRAGLGMLTGQAAGDGDVEEAEIVYDIVADAEAAMRARGYEKAQWDQLVALLREFRPAQYANLSKEELSASVYRALPALRGRGGRGVRSGGRNRRGVLIADLQERGFSDAE